MIIFTKKTTAGLFTMILALFILIIAVSLTVKSVGDLPDYHSVTSDTAKADTFVDGNIDKWFGPVASDGGQEYYFLPLDNGQIITYSTYDSKYKELMNKYDGEFPEDLDAEAIKIHCIIAKMNSEEQEVFNSILLDGGFEQSEIDEMLLPYCLIEYPLWFYIFLYVVSIGSLIFGFIMFLPKLKELLNRNSDANTQLSGSSDSTVTDTSNL